MNDTKKKLLEEIDRKIKRKKKMASRAIERNTIEAFVIAFMEEVTDINNISTTTETWAVLYPAAQKSLVSKLQTFDPKCSIEISWNRENEKALQVNGVLVRWSPQYQLKNNCEPELFIDIISLLFK